MSSNKSKTASSTSSSTVAKKQLSEDEIDDLLEDYSEVKDIYQVPLDTHLRYFSLDKDGKKQFRTGGFLHRNNGLPKYVMLTNRKQTWSVQIKGTDFFRKMSLQEIKKEYGDEIEEITEENEKLKKRVKLLEDRNYGLKEMIRKLKQQLK